ncbi:hypothetical protein QIX46_08495 [Lysinibacillus boronitolerans]|nr:hypothetical protein QIX46_08495 [Lysinibacillus boronitolerans]
MKNIILFFSLLAVLLVTSGCLNEMVGQKITVQKRSGEENILKTLKKSIKKNKWKKRLI